MGLRPRAFALRADEYEDVCNKLIAILHLPVFGAFVGNLVLIPFKSGEWLNQNKRNSY